MTKIKRGLALLLSVLILTSTPLSTYAASPAFSGSGYEMTAPNSEMCIRDRSVSPCVLSRFNRFSILLTF